MTPHDRVIALISGAAVQLLDACLLLRDGDVDAATVLALESVRVAREQVIA